MPDENKGPDALATIDVDDQDVQQMTEDLGGLVRAWVDRGVSPTRIISLLFRTISTAACDCRYPLVELLVVMSDIWKAKGGRW